MASRDLSSIDKLKVQAAKLQKSVREAAGNPPSSAVAEKQLADLAQRVRSIAKFGTVEDDAVIAQAAACPIGPFLDLVAGEQGFDGWRSLVREMGSSSPADDEATELYMFNESEFSLNVWCPTYEAAREYLDTRRGFYLLEYRGKCFLAQAPHIRGLGLDPNDPDWERIGRDWVKPRDPEAKQRLRDKLRAHREASRSR